MAGRRRRSRVRTRGRGAFRSRTRSNSSNNNATTSPNGDSNTTRGRRGNQGRRRAGRRANLTGRGTRGAFNNVADPFGSMSQSRSSSASGGTGTSAPDSGPRGRRTLTPGAGGGPGPSANPGPGGYGSQDNICPICRTQITSLCITNCNHRFCRDCIRRWTSRHATCPTCRANIHTIRNILPNGGTEIIQISRAELVAHKVNEIHSILMLLFTVMSHTLLPEVSNFLEQLSQIARELNVPTTTTRLENARAAAAQAAAANAGRSPRTATNSPAASTITSGSSGSGSNGESIRGRTGSMGSGSFGLALTRRPERSSVSRSRSRSLGRFSERAGSESDDEASDTDATVGSSSDSNSANTSPSDSAALVLGTLMGGVMIAKSLTNSRPPQASAGSAPPPSMGSKSLVPAVKAAAPGPSRLPVPIGGLSQAPASSSLSAGGKSLSAPDASLSASTSTKSAATQTSLPPARSRAPESSVSSSRSSSFDSSRDNPRIRYTYQQPGKQLAATGTLNAIASKSALGPSSSDRQGPMTRSASAAALMSASNQDYQQSRPPTEEEARRNQEQRQRDIRFLTDSFNKINQVYEVLMIMHMVIHRNQVEVEAPGEHPEVD